MESSMKSLSEKNPGHYTNAYAHPGWISHAASVNTNTRTVNLCTCSCSASCRFFSHIYTHGTNKIHACLCLPSANVFRCTPPVFTKLLMSGIFLKVKTPSNLSPEMTSLIRLDRCTLNVQRHTIYMPSNMDVGSYVRHGKMSFFLTPVSENKLQRRRDSPLNLWPSLAVIKYNKQLDFDDLNDLSLKGPQIRCLVAEGHSWKNINTIQGQGWTFLQLISTQVKREKKKVLWICRGNNIRAFA